MYSNKLNSFRFSLVVLVISFFLIGCYPDITFTKDGFYRSNSSYFGKIVNSNTLEPISDAKIICNNQMYESNSVGIYEINNLPEDFEVTIKVSKEGYEDFVSTVRITGKEAQELNISLIPIAKSL